MRGTQDLTASKVLMGFITHIVSVSIGNNLIELKMSKTFYPDIESIPFHRDKPQMYLVPSTVPLK